MDVSQLAGHVGPARSDVAALAVVEELPAQVPPAAGRDHTPIGNATTMIVMIRPQIRRLP
jgi:hypothetical protein